MVSRPAPVSTVILGLGLALVILLGPAGWAQAMQLTPVQKQEMKLHYEKATRAYDVQKYSEAVEEYQKAYEIGGDPAMLYNVAQSYRLSDQLPDALRFYRRYLQRSPNARNREDVERKIADLERTIEDRKKALAAAPPPPPPKAEVVAPAPSPKPVKVRTSNSDSSGMRVAGIVVASVGAAALAAAAITGKMASDKADELTRASSSGEIFDPNIEANGKTLNKVTIVSAIVGGAAVVTGAVLIVISQMSGGEERTVAARSPASRGGGASGLVLAPVVGADFAGASALLRF